MAKFRAALKKCERMQVYVGVPQSKSGRTKGGVTNAELMFIHSNGSRLQNIPARPVIEPAINAPEDKAAITVELKKAAQSAFAGNAEEAKEYLDRAGLIGQNAARKWFYDPRNNWPPDAPATIARKTRKGRLNKNGDPAAAVARPLIDTGQLQRAIVYVVVENGESK
ncbi:MAG: hypothetical protein ACR2JE_05805 [Acidobacteriaceae bacterium]